MKYKRLDREFWKFRPLSVHASIAGMQVHFGGKLLSASISSIKVREAGLSILRMHSEVGLGAYVVWLGESNNMSY